MKVKKLKQNETKDATLPFFAPPLNTPLGTLPSFCSFPSGLSESTCNLAMASEPREFDEKKQAGYALGTEVDGSDSFDTINALVAEGARHTNSRSSYQAVNKIRS